MTLLHKRKQQQDWNDLDAGVIVDNQLERPEKMKKQTLLRSIRNYFREYCQCTSIHGFRYFGEKRTIFERVWWFFVFIICVLICTYSIYTVYKKWENSPVIVTFATKQTPIYNIPFPAVTICPESRSRGFLFNYTDIMQKIKFDAKNVTSAERTLFEYMSLICHYDYSVVYLNNNTFSTEFYRLVDEVKSGVIFDNCKYMGKQLKCKDLFIPVFTDEGICYTFNMLDRSEIFKDFTYQYSNFHQTPNRSVAWTIEHGYKKTSMKYTYPHRALLAGIQYALSVDIYTFKEEIDYACKNSLQGYRIAVHIPIRVPRMSQMYFQLPLNQAVMAAMQPSMILTSDAVKLYNPRKRRCYFPSERQLKYFKIYSQMNCQMECLTNFTLLECDCVNYFMPRENHTDICGTGRLECMKDAEYQMEMRNLNNEFYENQVKKRNKFSAQIDCDCLPICTDVTYNVETSQSDLNFIEELKARQYQLGNLTEKDVYLSRFVLYFKSNHFIASERNVLYGPTDFLANFGGLLGLFTGFSVLSLMEIIYFLSVRLICNTRLYGYWAGAEN